MREFHPAANIFRLLAGEDFAKLVNSVRTSGLIEPIWLDEQGRILDGRNRYRACLEAGVEPRYRQWDGTGLAADFVWALNADRRHDTDGERQMAAGRYAIERESEAKERSGIRTDLGTSPSIEGEVEFGRSTEKAADKFGLGVATVERAVAVVKKGAPELVAAVEEGKVSVSAAAELATLPKEEQVKVVALTEREILEQAKIIRTKKAAARNEQLRQIAAKPVALPEGKFGVIVIDPPWPMQKIERDVTPNQVAFDYPVMSLEEIEVFGEKVEAMAADNCHLFMWTTQKFLPPALKACEVWGFRYVLMMVWRKSGGFQPFGLPQYNCEFVIYARRGSPQFVDTKAFPTCFDGARREHSRKPDEFYDMISRVTAGPRIDVFSREQRDGFAQFGNEADKFAGAA